MDDQPKGLIFDIKRYAVHDGPGIRTTVFLKGCPLKCQWCHSPESQHGGQELMYFPNLCLQCGECLKVCPSNAHTPDFNHKIRRDLCIQCGRCTDTCYSGALKTAGKYVTVKEVLQELMKDALFYQNSQGGITLSGGEPTMQPEFAKALLRACQQQGYHTALDTCGHVAWPVLHELLEFVDLVLYDVKHIDRGHHEVFTGVPNDLILANLKRLDALAHCYIIRVPLIPTVNDSQQDIYAMAQFFTTLTSVESIEILPYHRFGISKYQHLDRAYELKHLNIHSPERLESIVEQLHKHGLAVIIESLMSPK